MQTGKRKKEEEKKEKKRKPELQYVHIQFLLLNKNNIVKKT